MRTRSAASAFLVGAVAVAAVTVGPGPSAAAPPPARAVAAADSIDALLRGMSLREKAGQMVMPWIEGGLVPGSAGYRRAERFVRVHRVGGFIVGKGSGSRTAASLQRLQRASDVPLLVGADLEWGPGMRLLGGSLLPVAMALGATGDTALAYAAGLATAREARASGITMVFAPVLDVNVDPRNPIINTRSFGEDPRRVAALGSAMARGLGDGGVIAVGKHFPGHGDTDRDSHLTLPIVRASRARLDSVELVPFRRAIADDIGGIMVAHLAVPALSPDQAPATLSYAISTRLLRHELGFDGLVITDALNMAGVTREGEGSEIALRAVRAGADILLQPPNAELAIDAIIEAVQRGDLAAARVDASVRRILRAKAGLAADPAAGTWSRGAAERLAAEIAVRSIARGRDRAALLPVAPGRQVLSLVYSTVAVPGGPNEAFDFALRSGGLRVTSRTIPTARALAVADSLTGSWRSAVAPLVVVGVYAQAVPGRGRTGLPPAVADALEQIARAAPTVIVFFGDPYAAAAVPSASTVLFAWSGIPAAQRAAASALLGKTPITGISPD